MVKKNLFTNTNVNYFRRELKFEILPIDENFATEAAKLIKFGEIPFVEIDPIGKRTIDLIDLPKKSLIAVMNLDENSDLKTNFRIIRMKSVRNIIRTYPAQSLCFKNLLDLLKCNLELIRSSGFNFKNLMQLLKWNYLGILKSFRSTFISFLENLYKKKSIIIPLGYSDVFCEVFLDKLKTESRTSISSVESLFSKSVDQLQKKNSDQKIYNFSFCGQRGNFIRQSLTSLAEAQPNSRVLIRENFGGYLDNNLSTSYFAFENIELAEKSWFSVCPPGNISSVTYRYMESIILNSIPVCISTNPSDPSYDLSYLYSPIFVNSWSKLFSSALGLPLKNRIELQKMMKKNLIAKLADIESQLMKLITRHD